MKNNVSVGLLLDVFAHKADSFPIRLRALREEGNSHSRGIEVIWGDRSVRLEEVMPRLQFPDQRKIPL